MNAVAALIVLAQAVAAMPDEIPKPQAETPQPRRLDQMDSTFPDEFQGDLGLLSKPPRFGPRGCCHELKDGTLYCHRGP